MSLTEYGEFAETLMVGHSDLGQPRPSGGWPPSSQPVLPTLPLQKRYNPSSGHPAVLPNTPQSAATTPIYSKFFDLTAAIHSIDRRMRKFETTSMAGTNKNRRDSCPVSRQTTLHSNFSQPLWRPWQLHLQCLLAHSYLTKHTAIQHYTQHHPSSYGRTHTVQGTTLSTTLYTSTASSTTILHATHTTFTSNTTTTLKPYTTTTIQHATHTTFTTHITSTTPTTSFTDTTSTTNTTSTANTTSTTNTSQPPPHTPPPPRTNTTFTITTSTTTTTSTTHSTLTIHPSYTSPTTTPSVSTSYATIINLIPPRSHQPLPLLPSSLPPVTPAS
ncbi:hypothetical protein Pcinc_026203 [Petrolisthes cinctipes]|uniref:Uncharacterized protein n=1 Tax=Petrolisthes cinctipes TaxID=88211 RepID=A0AAE1F7S3_PETCI|nr:hypothetical protein Pcinc_026203 [Petrolisthes cinctipes]